MNPALETLMLVFSGEEALPVPDRALFLGAEPHPDLANWPQVIGYQPFKPKATEWDNAGLSRIESPAGKWPLVMLLPGKSKDETLAWFAIARNHLEPGGMIVAAMPNTAGAGRFEKELSKAAGNIHSVQKNKCRAFYATIDDRCNPAIFENWNSLIGRQTIANTHFTVEAGVFSSGHVDAGSEFLAQHLPAHLRGKVADLGAGWGYLTHELLERCPKVESVDLFEADSRALDCARTNLRKFSQPIGYHWHDVSTGISGEYDVILSNPPFHTGQATDVDLGRAFLTVATSALKRSGKLLLVANRQLPYEAVLQSSGLAWRKVAENETFKLLFADKR
ncbi:class I SAM-dependent methyltransferase [Luteolibacter pohnpeiensis]|uniref:Class I SAM-dependent methyltransferase n=1 Tax=Luteolibacter pohnpeiensis TaxID=454153 RepID=A0A934SCE1_9BACT|nr:methyltransferase [Luteolibacter pohnpeiensis]MBK1882693.1 class I SAM-dependent methyltransferase [Luteolibacter pohnpeiensis]